MQRGNTLMASISIDLPTDLLADIEKLDKKLDGITAEMVRAGGKVVYNNVMQNLPAPLKTSDFRNCIKLTKTYKTPSDGTINSKVMVVDGYFTNHKGKKVPAPLIANVFEYGRSVKSKHGAITKKPFFRKSIKKDEILNAMYEAKVKASDGLIDE